MKNSLRQIVIILVASVFLTLIVVFLYHNYFMDKIQNNLNISSRSVGKKEIVPLDKLKISFYDIRSPSFGFTSIDFKFILSFKNPTKYNFDSPRVFYNMFINDIHIGTGKIFLPDIPAEDERKYSCNLLISYIDIGKSLVVAIKEKKYTIELVGEIKCNNSKNSFHLSENYM